HGLGVGEPPEIFVVELVLAGFECRGQAPSVASGLGGDLHLFGARFFDQDGLFRPFVIAPKPGQRHRFVVNLDFIHGDEPLDETAQTVLLQVDTASRHRLRASYLWPDGSIWLEELITAWMLRANSTAPATSMSNAARA